MQTRALVVSLHDVSPLTRNRCQRILEDLREIGIATTSLLVIPNHHRKAPLPEHPDCAEWLRQRIAFGDEAVLHGYYHQRPSRKKESLRSRLITNYYTAGEGEFFDLTTDAAAHLLREGRSLFKECGLCPPAGFIAPAWLLGDAALKAVQGQGFLYTTYLNRILPLSQGAAPEKSQSLVWSVRAGWRRLLSLAWNQLLFARLSDARVLRIGLHPPDWNHPAIRRQILSLARRALVRRQPTSYEHWVRSHCP